MSAITYFLSPYHNVQQVVTLSYKNWQETQTYRAKVTVKVTNIQLFTEYRINERFVESSFYFIMSNDILPV